MADPNAALAATAMTGNPYVTLGAEALKNAAGGAAAPSAANSSNKGESAFGGGGYSVVYGNGNTQTTANDTAPKVGASGFAAYAPYAVGLFAVVVAWKMYKKH